MSLPRAGSPETAPPDSARVGRRRLPSARSLALIVGASLALWAPIVLLLRLLLG